MAGNRMKHFFKKWSFAFLDFMGGTLLLPSTASAHLVTTGLGPLYNGIGHLLISPDDLVPALALALYCGLRGARCSRFAIFILPLAWLLGGLCGTIFGVEPNFPLPALTLLILGIIVATDAPLPLWVVAPMTAIIGFAHGFFNGIVMRSGSDSAILELLGTVCALFVLITFLSARVVSLKKPWARLVVRIMGSWVAASGMLMIGWSLKFFLKQ